MPIKNQIEINLPLKLTQKSIEKSIHHLGWTLSSVTENIINCRSSLITTGAVFHFYVGMVAKSKQKTVVVFEASIVALFPKFGELFPKTKLRISEKLNMFSDQIVRTSVIMIKNEFDEKLRLDSLIESGQICPTCLKEIPIGTSFCPDDGTKIKILICPKCNNSNQFLSSFCSKCGEYLD